MTKQQVLTGVGAVAVVSALFLPTSAQAQCADSLPIGANQVHGTTLVFSGSTCTDRTVSCEGVGESRGKIRGTNQAGNGVVIANGAQRIRIVNCIIENWNVGIKINASTETYVWNNLLRNNGTDGVDCDGATRVDYWDNEATGNGENGFELDNCHDSNIWQTNPFIWENNRAFANGKHGFSFDNSDNHRLHANRSFCNGRVGGCGGAAREHLSGCGPTILGQGLRIQSTTCDNANPSTGIAADWNNWGEATVGDDNCDSNAGLPMEVGPNSTYDNMVSVYGTNTNRCSI